MFSNVRTDQTHSRSNHSTFVSQPVSSQDRSSQPQPGSAPAHSRFRHCKNKPMNYTSETGVLSSNPGTSKALRQTILSGRGGQINHHPANLYFRQLIDTRKLEYVNSGTKLNKRSIVQSVYDQLKSEGYDFKIQSEHNANKWIPLPKDRIMAKIAQCLREKSQSAPVMAPHVSASVSSSASKARNGSAGAHRLTVARAPKPRAEKKQPPATCPKRSAHEPQNSLNPVESYEHSLIGQYNPDDDTMLSHNFTPSTLSEKHRSFPSSLATQAFARTISHGSESEWSFDSFDDEFALHRNDVVINDGRAKTKGLRLIEQQAQKLSGRQSLTHLNTDDRQALINKIKEKVSNQFPPGRFLVAIGTNTHLEYGLSSDEHAQQFIERILENIQAKR